MDRELKNLTLNISQLAALSGVHRQTAAARLQNLPVAGGHESNLKLYRVVDIVSAFLALPPPVAEGEMDAHERKAWYQSERERLKFEQETAQLILYFHFLMNTGKRSLLLMSLILTVSLDV